MEMWTDFVDLNSCGGVASIAMVVKLIVWMETGVVSLSLAFLGNRWCSSAEYFGFFGFEYGNVD